MNRQNNKCKNPTAALAREKKTDSKTYERITTNMQCHFFDKHLKWIFIGLFRFSLCYYLYTKALCIIVNAYKNVKHFIICAFCFFYCWFSPFVSLDWWIVFFFFRSLASSCHIRHCFFFHFLSYKWIQFTLRRCGFSPHSNVIHKMQLAWSNRSESVRVDLCDFERNDCVFISIIIRIALCLLFKCDIPISA